MCIVAAVPGIITATQALVMNAVIAASVIASVAAPIMSHVGQQQAAADQAAYQQKMFDMNKEIADQALASQYAGITQRQAEEQRKAAMEMQAISSQAAQARAIAGASAAEGGVQGLSVDMLMNDYFRREYGFMEATQQQLRGTMFQLEQSKEAARSEYEGRVMGMTPQPVNYPSLLATGIGVVGGAASSAGTMYFNTFDRSVVRAGFNAGPLGTTTAPAAPYYLRG
jgi:hypothetical protein